jgi:DNA-directed RNA polymerase specialized sigma24 family protein
MSYEEIAEINSENISTLKSHLSFAKNRIQNIINDGYVIVKDNKNSQKKVIVEI